MPPKTAAAQAAAAAAAAAAAEEQKKQQQKVTAVTTNKVDDSQSVTMGMLVKQLDALAERINKNTDEKYEKLQTDLNNQRKDIVSMKKDTKSLTTAFATHERKLKDDNKAKKDIVVSNLDIISDNREEMVKEAFNHVKDTVDPELLQYEVRNVIKVGKETARVVITVISEHVRDRIICKALDRGLKNFKAGLSKADRQEKARVHLLKQECHEKNEKTAGNFLWEVWTPEGEIKSRITKFQWNDPKVKKLQMKYIPHKGVEDKAKKGRTSRTPQ